MMSLACSACRKRFSVEEAPAGKNARCPACGEPVSLPPTPGAKHAGQNKRTRSSQLDGSDALTLPPSNDPAATWGLDQPDVRHVSGLADFLAPPQAGDELGRLGKYRILKILGHGGMGVVFEAEDPKLKRKVAIKAMLPALAASASAGQRFLREAQAMAAVKHDHIVTIHQVDEERGIPFLAMEFLAGEPLEDRLERDGKLALPEVLRIGREIAEGLEAAHATGLIHRDVKPANIWLEAPRNRVKILDFGLARAASQEAGLTQQGAIVGTPAYMAPEQARGEPVDTRCDLFSLGVVLYQLCTGRRPFVGTDTISTLMEVALHHPPPPIRLNADTPQELSDLVMKLLEKEPDRRPASVSGAIAVLQALEGKLDRHRDDREEDIAIVPEPTGVPGAKNGGGRVILMLAVGLALLLLLGGWLASVVLRVEIGPDRKAAEWVLFIGGTVELDDRDRSIAVAADLPPGAFRLTGADLHENGQVSDAGLAHFEACKNLTSLRLQQTKVTAAKVEELKKTLPGCRIVWDGGENRPKASRHPDREAAEYVLSLGGTVRVNDQNHDSGFADLPQGAFRLTGVDLSENKKVSNEGLAALGGCKHLTDLNLFSTQAGDGGMAYLKGCKSLRTLNLDHTQVGDVGLASFKDCKGLTLLGLFGTRVSDAGLAFFKDCKGLTVLGLNNTQVSDAGLANFEGCRELWHLGLMGTQVSDAGLAYFKDCKRLTQLALARTQVGDAGLVHFKNTKGLTFLNLTRTQVGDAGLANFEGCKNLTDLYLSNTKVSEAGLVLFKDCKYLSILTLKNTKVTDLLPLKKMPLKDLRCDFEPARDAAILRSIKTLEKINGRPAMKFWKEVDAKMP